MTKSYTMTGVQPNYLRLTMPLILLIILVTLFLSLVTISSGNQLSELTGTIKNLSYSNTSLVELGNNHTNQVAEEISIQKKDANQFILYQAIWGCLCSRRFMYPPLSPQNQTHKLNSSCSDEGTLYQLNQKVISMSMFVLSRPSEQRHSALSYQISLARNLLAIRQNYPSYSLRIYTDVSLSPNSTWCKLLCENEDLFWCDIRRTPSYGNLSAMNFRTWRFLPLGDPTVHIFHSRDLDSLIGYREGAAVQDWLENVGYKAIQLMRDKRYHHNFPILAGMWGAQNSILLKNGKGIILMEKIIELSQLKTNQRSKPWDQIVLGNLIVGDSEIARDVVAYDSYHCKRWEEETMVRPFPVQRLADDPERDFVANIRNFMGDGRGIIYKAKKKDLECPVECRPSYGKDWIYC